MLKKIRVREIVRKWENFRCFVRNEVSEMFLIFQWLMTSIVVDGVALLCVACTASSHFSQISQKTSILRSRKTNETSSKQNCFTPQKCRVASLTLTDPTANLANFFIGGVSFNFHQMKSQIRRWTDQDLTTVSSHKVTHMVATNKSKVHFKVSYRCDRLRPTERYPKSFFFFPLFFVQLWHMCAAAAGVTCAAAAAAP